jgi:hypothetical protein
MYCTCSRAIHCTYTRTVHTHILYIHTYCPYCTHTRAEHTHILFVLYVHTSCHTCCTYKRTVHAHVLYIQTYCTYTRTVLTPSLTCNNSPLLSAVISAIIFCISPLLLLSFSPSLLLMIFTLFSACVHSAVSPPNSLRHTAKFNGIEGRGGKGGEREIVGGKVYIGRERRKE